MATPNYMKGRSGIKIPLHRVMDVIRTIHDLGHGDQFRQAAADKGAFVTLHPQTVNFVKSYVADNNLHQQSAVANDVVNGCPGSDPNQCPFQQN